MYEIKNIRNKGEFGSTNIYIVKVILERPKLIRNKMLERYIYKILERSFEKVCQYKIEEWNS